MKIRKDDEVVVIAGNDREKVGKVLRVIGDTVVIQGINVRKKHVKSTREAKGGIITIERPIHISNVMLSIDGKGVKLRSKKMGDGKKELYYRRDGKDVTYRELL